MRRLIRIWMISVASALAVLPADALARESARFTLAQRSEQVLPLEVVVARVARQIPGRLLNARGPFPRGGRWVYWIKWLTPEDRVLIIIADAQSGMILER